VTITSHNQSACLYPHTDYVNDLTPEVSERLFSRARPVYTACALTDECEMRHTMVHQEKRADPEWCNAWAI
jgi:hypothetical protein